MKIKGVTARLSAALTVRLFQLLRPLSSIFILRFIDKEIASQFVTLLSVYIIVLEIYNLIAPTDRLYFFDSNRDELNSIVKRRLLFSPLIAIFTVPILTFYLNISFSSALGIVLAAVINSVSTAHSSYLYTRLSTNNLSHAEAISWIVHLSAILITVYIKPVLAGFIVYAAEQSIRSIFLKIQYNNIKGETKESKNIDSINSKLTSMTKEGIAITVSNHINRLPFALSIWKIDPIFMIAAQSASAVYNMLLGLNKYYKIPNRHGLYLLLSLALVLIFSFSNSINSYNIGLILQTTILCLLAILHGAQMTHLPGKNGVASSKTGRSILLVGFLLIAILGSTFNPAFFLFSPAILSIACIFHFKIKNESL